MEISCSSSTALMACRPPARPSAAPRSSLAFSSSALFSAGLPARSLCLALRPRRRSGGAGPAARRLGCRCLFGLGVPELAVIAGVAALVFGPKKLPEIGRSIGKTVKSFQQAAKEFETELKKDPENATEPSPPAEGTKAVGSQDDEKKELEASGTKEST